MKRESALTIQNIIQHFPKVELFEVVFLSVGGGLGSFWPCWETPTSWQKGVHKNSIIYMSCLPDGSQEPDCKLKLSTY